MNEYPRLYGYSLHFPEIPAGISRFSVTPEVYEGRYIWHIKWMAPDEQSAQEMDDIIVSMFSTTRERINRHD